MKTLQLQPLRQSLLVLLMGIACFSEAKQPDDQLARLGNELTPLGGEKAGNKDGSIPAWTGGLTKLPVGTDLTKARPNPYGADKPLFTITGTNAEQYKDMLAPGQLTLLQRYPSYKMIVYPSHRSTGYPDAVNSLVRKEAATADFNADGALVGVDVSPTPFPIPKNGREAMINHVLRYRGETVKKSTAEFPVQVDGKFTPTRRNEEIIWASGFQPHVPGRLYAFRTKWDAPSSIAGEAVLVLEPTDQGTQPRQAWVYNPGSRRVLRAPEIGNDSPHPGGDGLATSDDYEGFNGSTERYNWKLVGKREMIISYNNFKLADRSLKYSEIIKPATLNQDLVRYELHRVWVVEATLKPGKPHIYGKRVYFLDEDSWQIAHGDLYDGRGDLWRVFEGHAMQFAEAPSQYYAGTVQYDLQSRRYFASYMMNEEAPIQFNVPLRTADFTSDALRRLGN